MLNNFKATIQYDGTNYSGWQIQPEQSTIQGMLQQALYKITGENINIYAAGRTDAGVHALGQVASFKLAKPMEAKSLLSALNSLLPSDIKLIKLIKAPDDFNAHRSAKSKEYKYQIFTGKILSPFSYRYVYHLPFKLDIEEIRAGASKFLGENDFSAFKSSASACKNPIRHVFKSNIAYNDETIYYNIEANGFLQYMVRTIVGTLIEVGKMKISPSQIDEIFASKQRSLAGATAPPQGLFLVRVNY